MIIIGIDPSLTSTGTCLMSEDGEVIISKVIQPKIIGLERLAFLRQQIINIIAKYDVYDIRSFVEGYSHGSSGMRESIAEWGGVLRLTLYENNLQIIDVPPKTLKKFATGNGNADKILMGVQLMKEFGMEYPTSDQTDAYWLAFFGRAYHGLIPNLTKAREEIIADMKDPKVKKKKVAKK